MGDVNKCDHPTCDTDIHFRIYAAYPVDSQSIHPHLARYPAAMYRTCRDHLASHLEMDGKAAFSTDAYYVEKVGG